MCPLIITTLTRSPSHTKHFLLELKVIVCPKMKITMVLCEEQTKIYLPLCCNFQIFMFTHTQTVFYIMFVSVHRIKLLYGFRSLGNHRPLLCKKSIFDILQNIKI